MPLLPPCAHVAEVAYSVPVKILETVAAHRRDGIGPLGIQPAWMPVLQQAGFDPQLVQGQACWGIIAGAWIIARAGGADISERHHVQTSRLQHVLGPPGLDACVSNAAGAYLIPEPIYRAVLKTESGQVGKVVYNKNGTYDMGPAQINSSHLPELAAMGVTRDQIINNGCLNLHVGAWILSRELGGATLSAPTDFWRRVGNYNSRTPRFNQAYQAKVWKNLRQMASSR